MDFVYILSSDQFPLQFLSGRFHTPLIVPYHTSIVSHAEAEMIFRSSSSVVPDLQDNSISQASKPPTHLKEAVSTHTPAILALQTTSSVPETGGAASPVEFEFELELELNWRWSISATTIMLVPFPGMPSPVSNAGAGGMTVSRPEQGVVQSGD